MVVHDKPDESRRRIRDVNGRPCTLVNARDDLVVIEDDVQRARQDVHDADANLVRVA